MSRCRVLNMKMPPFCPPPPHLPPKAVCIPLAMGHHDFIVFSWPSSPPQPSIDKWNFTFLLYGTMALRIFPLKNGQVLLADSEKQNCQQTYHYMIRATLAPL